MKNRILNFFIGMALLIYSNCIAQKSDYIVTKTNDTIYVDTIILTDFKVKTKTADKKKNYNNDEILSYYLFSENKYYERIANQIEIKKPEVSDRYDYRKLENSYIEDYKNRIKYKFIERLTEGKVKLLCEVIKQPFVGTGIPGTASYTPAFQTENRTYYISIYDSKLELIDNKGDLKLNKEVYEILKIYLNGNTEINIKLDNLFTTKPIAKEKQIIDLINEYNIWVKTNK